MNANPMSCWGSLLVLLLLVALEQHLANPLEMVKCEPKVNLARLSTDVQPSHYKLYLRLDPSKKGFSGKVDIELNFNRRINSVAFLSSRSVSGLLHPFLRNPRKIILHADDLDVYNVSLLYEHDLELRVEGICYDATYRIIVLELNNVPYPETSAVLTLNFAGQVRGKSEGLFMSSIGSSKALATYFKPNYARSLFPCFDEPEFKATFDLTIEHPPAATALSNMPTIRTLYPPIKLGITSFEITPKISTYLLSIVVGYFDHFPNDMLPVNIPKITIYAPEGCVKNPSSMIENFNRAYNRVSNFFEAIPQPLRKIDIVAVKMQPRAMESWGLITMKSDILCAHENMLKPEERNHVITAPTSMMVRHWLGNLVTGSWWSDLWFIEGLANYFTSELTNELYRGINSKMYTLLDTTVSAMKDDQDCHKIVARASLQTAEKIYDSYDSFTLKKSEALFRMFAHVMGREKFNSVILELIRSNVGGLISVANWWRNLEVHTHLLHRSMLTNIHMWTQQAGYPIIYVSLTTQQRMYMSQKSNLRNERVWPVPVSYKICHVAAKGCPYRETVVLTSSGKKVFGLPGEFNPYASSLWLKVNPGYKGYYRVVYKSFALREALVNAVKSGRMSPVDRLQLISDSYDNSKRTGLVADFGKLFKVYMSETNDGVVLQLTSILFELYHTDKSRASSPEVKKLMTNYHEIHGGVEGEAGSNVLRQYTRGHVLLYLVAFLKVETIITEVKKYKNVHGALPPFFEHVDPYLITTDQA